MQQKRIFIQRFLNDNDHWQRYITEMHFPSQTSSSNFNKLSARCTTDVIFFPITFIQAIIFQTDWCSVLNIKDQRHTVEQ